MVKHLPAVWETQVKSLGREDPLEKEMVTTPVLLPEKLHGLSPEEPGRLHGVAKSDSTERLYCHILEHIIKAGLSFYQNKLELPKMNDEIPAVAP